MKKLYEGNATGKIPNKHFTRLLAEYDKEQIQIAVILSKWQTQIDIWKADSLKTDHFLELVKRYADFLELTTPMLNEFVETVVSAIG